MVGLKHEPKPTPLMTLRASWTERPHWPVLGTIDMRVFSPSANFPRPVNTRGRDAAAKHAQPWSCWP